MKQQATPRKYMRVKQVAARYGVSSATIWRWSNDLDGFPKPLRIKRGTTAWSEAELDDFDRRAEDGRRAA